jgi:hypothetical protein
MDQTPLPFEFLDERTYDGLGTQSVQIKKFVWSLELPSIQGRNA